MSYLFWFIACAVLILIELLTTSLIFASFAFGAFIAGLAGLLGAEFVGQGLAFAVASILAVFLFRPILSKRFVTRNSANTTNVLALVGSTASVVETVTSNSGLVKIKGEIWSARTDASEIPAGQASTVTDIDGATLIVTQSKN